MLRNFHNEPANRMTPKTSQQLFRRIDVLHTRSQSRLSRTSKGERNFPHLNTSQSSKNLHTGKSLDNSKQNLTFQSYLQKVNSASRIDEKSIVGNYLNSLRKDYDKMHKETKQHLSSINLKKKDIEFMKQRVKMQQQSMKNLDLKMEDRIKQLSNIKQKQQQVETQRKTLDHVIVRMKKDQIFYKQFGRVFEGHLNQKKKVLKSLNKSILTEDQKIHKLIQSIENMRKQLEKNQQFRERKLEDYCEKLENIQQKEMFIQQRKQRTLQLQSIESNDILKAKNLEMRSICLINKVADSLFQSKMQRLINKYSQVQKAFHTIQVKTSISNPTLIADKFFSYGELTENLMKSINNYEKVLDEKTKRNQQLKAVLRKIEERNLNNQSVETKKQSCKKLTIEQINAINERQLVYKKIIDWIDRQAKKMKIPEITNAESIVKKFVEICMKTKSDTQELAKTFTTHEKYVTPGIRIKKLVKESQIMNRSQKNKDTTITEPFDQQMNEDESLKAIRAGVKRNIMKQKTMNLGNLNNLNEEIIDDKNIKTIENL